MMFARFPALSRRQLLAGLGAATLGYGGPPGLLRAKADTSAGRPAGVVSALAFDRGRLVLAATGLWVSADDGVTFKVLSEGPGAPVTAMAAHPDLAGTIYATTLADGLQRSVDGGLTWLPAGPGLPSAPMDAVAIAAHDPQLIYVAVRGDGLWQSKDGAKTWEFAMDRPLMDKVEVDVQVIASVGSLSGMGGYWVYAGTAKGASRVPDCFCRWSSLDSAGAMAVSDGTAKPAPDDSALRLPDVSVTSLALAPSVPEVLFAGLPSGIWKSADTGATWALASGELASPILAVNPLDPNHVVAAAAGGTMLSSRDGGLTWSAPAAV